VSSRDDDLLRSVTREVLAELLPELIEDALTTPAPSENGNGHRTEPPAVPQVPAPPIAKVHRPSGWRPSEPAAEEPAAEAGPGGAVVEHVELRTDAELEAFVSGLARRLESPGARDAILSGRVRFRLGAGSAEGAPGAQTIRVEAGAVTERVVKEAARAGARLVLSPRAVLTPTARDSARSLGVEIEKEKPC
jgi:hypothetical protein